MAGIIVSGSFSKDLLPSVNKWFGDYKDYQLMYPKFMEVLTSDRAFEEDVLATGLGLPSRMPQGTAVTYDDMGQGGYIRYTHSTYGLGFIVTKEAVEDGQSGVVVKKKATALKRSMLYMQDLIAADVLNNAFDSTVVGFDGKSLCASDHPLRSGGTLSNKPSVDVDLSESALEDARVSLMSFTDDRGIKIPVMIKRLITSPSLTGDVVRLMNSSQRVGTADNDASTVKSLGLIPEHVELIHLTDSDAWFLQTDIPDGLKFFVRRAIQLTDDSDHDTDNAKYKATMRLSTGFSDFRQMFGCAGA